MKYSLLVAIIVILLGFASATDFDAIIREVNKKQSSWVAEHNHLTKKSISEIKQMLGLQKADIPTNKQLNLANSILDKPKYSISDNDLPENFDATQKWPKCIHPIRNQQKCGSCWAFSATEQLSDRACIATNGTVNVVLSAQDPVSCSSLNFGCNGGQLALVQLYMFYTGVVPDTCLPYVSGDGHVPGCPSTCQDGSGRSLSSLKVKAKTIYPLWVDWPAQRVNDMKKDLVTFGPIQTGFMVYEDFLAYKSGVYKHTSGQLLGGHAVKIVGYGVDSATGEPYWKVANSWSEQWGENGYFRILLGADECGFELSAWGHTVSSDLKPPM